MADEHDHQGVTGGTGFLARKLGPLPTWVWMALVLLVLLGLSLWQRNKQGSASSSDTSGGTLPDQTPPWIIQNYVTSPPGSVRQPPDGGNECPPPGGPVKPPPTTPPGGTPTPVPAPNGQYVTVGKYTTKNPPWNSTLWGIAKHLGIGSWQTIWDAPENASLKSRRKDPKFIQPGDRVWVPGK